ncbi:MAG: hypothetical protein UX80_C0006G0064 [Candidatus Amesbacteria bacterium GW2011_GWA2_47_11b]|uniref:Uncharacterized protein n=2 Tax=Candidatus Amesiibacteriota TaxID=1752730 RepID=A0A0G1SIB0_9BACT|nr:MAG: hypothetical protein UX42_C0003G0058 [Microgenomates group bacterium GW2011_GWC1_46_20]KKU58094.1 MAG: hypothetical protein UX80_C0006G0064 [Candidatus Amesbacteria bacterium GW2011_GWA2_47_11b]KKU69141.1 MAG: hypothetical protein UX92_C0014G0032 [Candidatus Amesbacteria bacterium GW2011_GWA1_47_20]
MEVNKKGWRDWTGWVLAGAVSGSIALVWGLVQILGKLCGCL